MSEKSQSTLGSPDKYCVISQLFVLCGMYQSHECVIYIFLYMFFAVLYGDDVGGEELMSSLLV